MKNLQEFLNEALYGDNVAKYLQNKVKTNDHICIVCKDINKAEQEIIDALGKKTIVGWYTDKDKFKGCEDIQNGVLSQHKNAKDDQYVVFNMDIDNNLQKCLLPFIKENKIPGALNSGFIDVDFHGIFIFSDRKKIAKEILSYFKQILNLY